MMPTRPSALVTPDGPELPATLTSTNALPVPTNVIPLLTATTPTADTNASANKDTTATDESMDLDAKMSTNAQKECTTADLNQSVKTTTAVSVANVDQDSSETHQLFDAPSRKHQRDVQISTMISLLATSCGQLDSQNIRSRAEWETEPSLIGLLSVISDQFFIQFQPTSDPTMVLTHAESNATQELLDNTLILPKQ
jgi:hypothetical protein